jgi:hypothetical protein
LTGRSSQRTEDSSFGAGGPGFKIKVDKNSDQTAVLEGADSDAVQGQPPIGAFGALVE